MKKNGGRRLMLVALSVVGTLLVCAPAYAQTVTGEEKYDWFIWRLPVWAAYGFALGVVTALLVLRRVKYVPEELRIDEKVRKRFFISFAASVLLFVISLWVDVWLIYNFESTTLNLREAISEAMSGWYWLALVCSALITFYLGSLLFTGGSFSGRYALKPGPKAQ